MVDMRVEIKTSGPVFTGAAQAAVDDFLAAAGDTVAAEGVATIRRELRRVLRNPTGFYESQVRTDNTQQELTDLVTDGGVVYGPWLAGTGRRNISSRFKGYQHWQRGSAELRRRAQQIAETVLPQFLRRMN